MKELVILREELPEVLRCLIGIDQKGKIKFPDWLKINETIISVKNRAKEEDELLQKIKVESGFDKYVESIRQAQLKGIESYTHSDDEIKAIEDFEEKNKAFLKSEITIKVNMIPQSVLENLPKEALEFRIGIMKLVELKKERDQPRASKK